MDVGNVFIFLVATGSLLINVVVLYALTKQKSIQCVRSNRFVMNILMAQVFIALGVILRIFIKTKIWLTFFGYSLAIYSMATLSLDRFISVELPFRYLSIPASFHWFMVVSSWMLSLALFTIKIVLNFHAFHYVWLFNVLNGIFTLTAGACVLIINTVLFRTARRHANTIRTSFRSCHVAIHHLEACKEFPNKITSINDTETTFTQNKEDIRLVYACFGSTLTAVLCVGPLYVVEYISNIQDSIPEAQHFKILVCLACVNSWCDPFLFVYFNKKLKVTISSFLPAVPNVDANTNHISVVNTKQIPP